MITAIRRLFSSSLGKFCALAFLGLIAFAFAASDISGGGAFGGLGGANAARVGDKDIGIGELRQRVREAYEQARQRQPGLSMTAFVEAGGVDNTLQTLINASAIKQYARKIGFSTSKRLIDGRIADIPIFAGLTGEFDQQRYTMFLQNQNITDRQMRDDIERQLLFEQFIDPIDNLPSISPSLVQPYAALLFEERRGRAAFIPAYAYAPDTVPDDKVLAQFLVQNQEKYSIAERRMIRYAIFDRSSARASAPSDAEIAADYEANKTYYQASEKRSFSQIIAPSEAMATQIVADIRSGSNPNAAARKKGLSASMIVAVSQKDFAAQTNETTAKVAFTSAENTVINPESGPLGWVVLRVEEITSIAARSLEQATPEIRTKLAVDKAEEAIIDLYNAVQDAVNNGAPVEEIAGDHKLKIIDTPAILASGQAPSQPRFILPASLSPMLGSAFLESDDASKAQLINLANNEAFAIFEVREILPPAPPPLAKIRRALIADWRLEQGQKQAAKDAQTIAKEVESGKTLRVAVRTVTPKAAGPVQQFSARRGDMMRGSQRIPPEITLLFSMSAGSVETLEIAGNSGWAIIVRDQDAQPFSPSEAPKETVDAIAEPLSKTMGNELVLQLLDNAKKHMGVEIVDSLVEQVKRDMTGSQTLPI